MLVAARDAGLVVAMVTLTVRHGRSDALADLWDSIATGWRSITTAASWTGESPEAFEQRLSSWWARGEQSDRDKAVGVSVREGGQRAPRGWKDRKVPTRRIGRAEQLGVLGMMRAVEVTRGAAGWHPHVHALVFMNPREPEPGHSQALTDELQGIAAGYAMFDLWTKGLAKGGFEAWRDSGGLHVDVMKATAESIAGYVTKLAAMSGISEVEARAQVREGFEKSVSGLALETTRSDLKKSRGEKGETPFALLARAVEGEAEAVAAWLEYLRASQGRRMIYIPQVLRDLGKLGAELTDEEIVEADEGDADVLWIPGEAWRAGKVWRYAAQLLTELENGGIDALCSGLDMLQVSWRKPSRGVHDDGPHDPLGEPPP